MWLPLNNECNMSEQSTVAFHTQTHAWVGSNMPSSGMLSKRRGSCGRDPNPCYASRFSLVGTTRLEAPLAYLALMYKLYDKVVKSSTSKSRLLLVDEGRQGIH
eukprot:5923683-Amphidinium_carterae.1